MNLDSIMKDFNNSGFCNTGTMNSGDMNTGDYNIGSFNCGNRNAGDFNTGDFNFGEYNTGDFNLAKNSTGVFCTEQTDIYFFDSPTSITIDEWRKTDAYKILSKIKTTRWIKAANMTLEEKNTYPNFNTNNGYLKSISLKEGIHELWRTLTNKEKEIIKSIPNFDEAKFKKITGLVDIS